MLLAAILKLSLATGTWAGRNQALRRKSRMSGKNRTRIGKFLIDDNISDLLFKVKYYLIISNIIIK
jgi:hypothetical protein